MFELASLFAISFAAATLLPLASEGVLIGLVLAGDIPALSLWLAASAGNILGGVVNIALGRWGARWIRIPPVTPRLDYLLRHYGVWSLLGAWLPVIGDPLCVLAGWLRWPWLPCVAAMAVGKALRYAGLIWLL